MDRKAADAVRSRIDWKYALGLELEDAGFDSTVLCEFRSRLVEGSAERRLLEAFVSVGRDLGWLKSRGRQRTDSTHVLGRIRALNRFQCVITTFRAALNAIATFDPQWFWAHVNPEWVDRYSRLDAGRLPTGQKARQTLVEQAGADGNVLLETLFFDQPPSGRETLPAIQTLIQVWRQQFFVEAGAVRWRTEPQGIPPSSLLINSPFDIESRYAKKRSTSWTGYKVHLTESCDSASPHLILHVETTPNPVADGDTTPMIHQALRAKALLPAQHLVDTGYLDACLLVQSQQDYGIDLVGPTRLDYRWQSRAETEFAVRDFQIDWDHQQVTCPAGRTSMSWTPAMDSRRQEVIKIKFSVKDCGACPHHSQCTKTKRRTVTIRSREAFGALHAARAREETEEFRQRYAQRAGIEGTISQGVRACGLRRSRYAGKAKTHLQDVATATAMNLIRIDAWLINKPQEQTRTPAFVTAMKQAMAS